MSNEKAPESERIGPCCAGCARFYADRSESLRAGAPPARPDCATCSGRGWYYTGEDDLNGTYCGCAAGDDQRSRDGAASRDAVA